MNTETVWIHVFMRPSLTRRRALTWIGCLKIFITRPRHKMPRAKDINSTYLASCKKRRFTYNRKQSVASFITSFLFFLYSSLFCYLV